MALQNRNNSNQPVPGFSVLELIIVLAIASILTAVAVPQMISQRRLTRSVAMTREIMTKLRFTRQTAMSNRRAFTFQYDDATKEINIIGPITPGTTGLVDGAYPNNAGSNTVSSPLAAGGLLPGEILYGIPTASPALPTGPLPDGVSKTDLVNSKLNITFQPDGSVIDTTGATVDRALFIFNKWAPEGTASAVSILGSSGRIKVWRYSSNGNQYAE